MNLTLTATFESVEEMHDWVLKTAEGLRPVPDPLVAQQEAELEVMKTLGSVLPDIAGEAAQAPATEPAPKPKKKRTRRTKAQIEADRAAAEAAKKESITRASDGDVSGEHGGNGKDPVPEPEISETELRRQYAEAFRGVLEHRLEEGVAVVKGTLNAKTGEPLKRFSEGTLEQQAGMLDQLGVSLTAG